MSSLTQPHATLHDLVDLVKNKRPATNATDDHPQSPPLGIHPAGPRHDEQPAEQAERSMTVADIHTALSNRKEAAKDDVQPERKTMPSEGQKSTMRGQVDGEATQSPGDGGKKASAEDMTAPNGDGKPPLVHDGKAQSTSMKSHRRRPTVQTDVFSETSPRPSTARSAVHSHRQKASTSGYGHQFPGTPSGPPRSISFHYSLSGANTPPRSISGGDEDRSHFLSVPSTDDDLDYHEAADFAPATSPFRSALEYEDPEQREREREIAERKGKRREREGYFPDTWKRWLADSPREEPAPFTSEDEDNEDRGEGSSQQREPRIAVASAPSSPRLPAREPARNDTKDSKGGVGAPKWGRLRSLLPHLATQGRAQTGGANALSVVVPNSVNITDELISGGLATLMLRFWFERDEKGHRRVPVLFHRLRIRVSDSLHPMHGHKAVFRIECEYANGAVRWVIYRQLREFLSLHTHYAFSNAYNRNVETLPDFPRTSLPYFKWLKERDGEVGRADFARLQREALENYLIGLIRAVMFHPAANRLAGFLEVGALTIALAQSGGAQYKAGFLKIKPSTNKGTFGRKNTSWRDKQKQRWCVVRESYLVSMEEMGELNVYDVFLLDQDFKIERPKRYYRQPLHLLTQPEGHDSHNEQGRLSEKPSHDEHRRSSEKASHDVRSHVGSTLGSSIKSCFSTAFSFSHHHHGPQDHHADMAQPNEKTDGHVSTSQQRGTRRFNSESENLSSDEESEDEDRPVTPMLDPSTNTNPLDDPAGKAHDGQNEHGDKKKSSQVSQHVFYVENSQMRLKLFAKNKRQMLQWIAALEKAARESHYTGRNRFDSFAPIRLNVAAQWLVDGRDYFWNLSRAILLAKECIYIHDWWLSPELQLRRPGMEKYRLDHLLERKAKEGVKIYIILYQEVSSRTTPTDSNYAKQRLTALHPSIMVQRSPSHFQTGTFYWAHHEKMCVIDQAIAFMGGLDICFGRWDTPQHVLIDDPEVSDGSSIWPGKDYSNPRVQDFHTLSKPEDDMYDRAKVPRMPWHDVSMQVVGQPARDLARHFVQRWNYLLRIKSHTRQMPMLLPPSDFRPGELTAMGLTGTCELQICRSAGPWSLGTPERVEHSIQNAYLKAIQLSEHFVYIENQFFITSTVVNETKVENKIGDAIVHRIIRAHREGTPWKCCILIPLLPGFTFPVDHSDASAIRIILECQNRTIARGPNSIFSRLRKEGIDPDNYISVFSLRNWGKLRHNVLTTEQVYIHAKVCIVDDRLAIIGSANINERSQRGDRDSEIAAVIRDTDMIDSKMAGKPYKVGRFAHTLRVRLMREHLGVDVDALYEDDLMAFEPTMQEHEVPEWDPDKEQEYGREDGVTRLAKSAYYTPAKNIAHDVADGLRQTVHGTDDIRSRTTATLLRKTGLQSKSTDATANDASLSEERKTFNKEGEKVQGFASSIVPTLEEKTIAEHGFANGQGVGVEDSTGKQQQQPETKGVHVANDEVADSEADDKAEPSPARADGELYGTPAYVDTQDDDYQPQASDGDDEDQKGRTARSTLRRHLTAKLGSRSSTRPWLLATPTPHVDPYGFEDPICDEFWKETWVACAVHNTEIYRKVFHAIPDDLVTTWKQYKEFIVHHERLSKPLRDQPTPEPVARMPSEAGDPAAPGPPTEKPDAPADGTGAKGKDFVEEQASTSTASAQPQESRGRKPTRGAEAFTQADRDAMERLLEEVRGHLVIYPNRFLEGEDAANNFLFNADRLLPLPIYD